MASLSQKRQRLVLGLYLLLTLLVGAIAYLLLFNKRDSSGSIVPIQDITQVRIERNGSDAIVLQRNDVRGWDFVEPITGTANAQRVEPLLSISTAFKTGYSTSEIDLAAAGLTEPAFTVYFDIHKILIGGPDYSEERRYAQHNDVVSFVPEWVNSLLNGGVAAFVQQ